MRKVFNYDEEISMYLKMKETDIEELISTLREMGILNIVDKLCDARAQLDKIVNVDYYDKFKGNCFIEKDAKGKLTFRSQAVVAHEVLLGKIGGLEKSCQKSVALLCHWLLKLEETAF